MAVPEIGITFSHFHLSHLGMSIPSALDLALSYSFSHIRLGCYWNQIERKKGIFDFSSVQTIVRSCEEKGQKVIMSIGIKAPRWPEFHIPSHILTTDFESEKFQEQVLLYINNCIENLRQYTCITHWQVENEPLDPSGPQNRTIPTKLLLKEVSTVRHLDERPILLTLWGNDLESRGLFQSIYSMADVIGLDLYYSQFVRSLLGRNSYSGPRTSKEIFRKIIDQSKKKIIITELQAEPWEKNEQGYLSDNPQSISPELMRENIKKAMDLGVSEIILWGFEYWYYQMKKGNEEYMNVLKEFGCHTPSGGGPGVV